MEVKVEKHYLQILEAMPNPIWRTGIDAKCNYFNKAWLEFTGRSLEQELGDGWAEGVHPEDLNRCLKTYLDAFNKKEPFVIEYRLKHNSGNYHWLLDYGNPFYDLDGNFAGYLGSCYDIEDRKLTEESFKNALEEAQRRMIEIASIQEATRAVLMNYKFTDAAMTIFNFCKESIGAAAGYVALLSEKGDENEVLFLDSGGLPCLKGQVNSIVCGPLNSIGRFDLRRRKNDLHRCP